MAELVLEGVSDRLVSAYNRASLEAKQQLTKVFEDVLQLWTQSAPDEAQEARLNRETWEFITHLPTFPLDWEHQKMTREEMNER